MFASDFVWMLNCFFHGPLPYFSHPPKRRRTAYARGFHPALASASTLYFFSETAAWNHLTLYMQISLCGLFSVCENGGTPYTP